MLSTRQAVTARIAELYDPAGLMEPLKLQLKLHLLKLNGKDWKTPLSPRRIDLLEKYICGFCKAAQDPNTTIQEEEKGALKECYSDPFMTSRELDTLPSSSGLNVLKSTVDQPAPPGYLGPSC